MATAPLLEAYAWQEAWCGSAAPFTARVLARGRRWLERDEEAFAALAAVAPDPGAAAVPLRWLAALHHLALRGLQPWARLWPPAAPSAQTAAGPGQGAARDDAFDVAIDDAIVLAWRSHRAHLDAALALPPQTNEVQRSVLLLPGLMHVARATGLPLALLEIGASAGLNLWCDRYRHDHGHWAWGDAAAPLTLRARWDGPPPAGRAVPLAIVRRAACDADPVDIAQPDEGLRLESFIWPDQPDRLARLRAARRAAAGWFADAGLQVQRCRAADFVARELQATADGAATVLMHSVVWQYIGAAEQAAITGEMAQAGDAAARGRRPPLAWLRLEPLGKDGEVGLRCRLWQAGSPGEGQDELLARAHPHGAQVQWLAGGAA